MQEKGDESYNYLLDTNSVLILYGDTKITIKSLAVYSLEERCRDTGHTTTGMGYKGHRS